MLDDFGRNGSYGKIGSAESVTYPEDKRKDPLTFIKCQGRLRITAFIEDDEVIKKILKHLGLWEIK